MIRQQCAARQSGWEGTTIRMGFAGVVTRGGRSPYGVTTPAARC
jgi:hypothetical protein